MRVRQILILLLFTLSLNSYSQAPAFLSTDVDITELQIDSIGRIPDSILIIGIGSSMTRVFLDRVSNKLIEEFTDKSVYSEYHYLGRTTEEAQPKYNDLNKSGFKSLLVLQPIDSGTIKIDYHPNQYPSQRLPTQRTITPTNNLKELKYHQTFNLKFYTMGTKLNKIWSGFLEVDCDPTKEHGGNRVAIKIIKCFRKNGYINK